MKKLFQSCLAVLLVGCLVFLSFPDEIIAHAKASKKTASDTCKEICDEGIVMLKNSYFQDDKGNWRYGLPLENKKLNIFGFGGCDEGWYYQGNGSGAGSTANRVSLYQAFRDRGFAINEKLAADYNGCGLTNHVPVTEDPKINYQIHETSPEFVQSRLEQARDFSDQALVVFSRYGGEGNDLPKFQYKKIGNEVSYDTSRIYSQLSSEEEEILNSVASEFKHIYVLFNTCNPMQMGFLNNDAIVGALYMPMGGNSGTYCVPDVMSGDVNPSGHLTDIVPFDFKADPTYENMSYEADKDDINQSFERRYNTKRFTDHKNEYIHYAVYEENIYHGYWYYETKYENDEAGYKQAIQYPFGYGLSYTKFEKQVESMQLINNDETLHFTIKVTNTGSVPGKDVVQLYVKKPYLGTIEKPAKQLVGFAKTDALQPGTENPGYVYIDVNIKDMADYDCYDLNGNGFMGYELENGDYNFYACSDSHDAGVLAGTWNPHENITIKTLDMPNPNMQNLFTEYTTDKGLHSTNSDKHPDEGRCASIDGSDFGPGHTGIGVTYLSRKDNFAHKIAGYANLAPKIGEKDIKTQDYEQTYKVLPPWKDEHEIASSSPNEVKAIDDVDPTNIKDKSWDQLMDKLTLQDMQDLVVKGGFQTIAIPKINKKLSIDKDGPCGFAGGVNGSTAIPSNFPSDSMVGSTWNYQMAYNFGKAIGDEGVNRLGGINGCYGPGLDLHRSPLGGRNFEYYSEDPLLSGVLCSFQISGCMEEGMYCYVKHIAMNDSDMGRNGRYNFATEQTFRQIYAKPFEIITKGAVAYNSAGEKQDKIVHPANAAMASVDRLGSTRTTGSYNFLNRMLREEWGFQGSVITDYYQSGNVNDVDEGIRCGNDLMLNGANNCQFDDKESNTHKYWVRQAAKNILFTYANTRYIAKKDLFPLEQK